ncbi:MAG: class I SAM-dependent methyltransferase [Gemmatimonadales bacterium]
MSPEFSDHFSAVAEAYAAARPTYPPALFEHLASLAPARGHAWDCAAGNGQATLGLAAQFARVTATDASEAQIAQAPSRTGITWRVGLAHESGLPDASVDLVTVAQALHWIDLPSFYEEVRRVVVPGGLLAVWCYGIQRVEDEATDRRLEDFYGTVVGPYWAPERTLVETGYRSVPFPFDELPVPAFEMRHDWLLDELLAYIRTWSATAAFIEARGFDPVSPLGRELAPSWGPSDIRRCVRWPLSLRIGRPRRTA